jgi:hypothetical protein
METPMPTLVIRGPSREGLVAALRELLELKDRRIQATAFFFACGASVVLHGTVLNGAADNPEHVLVGYGLFTIGAGLGFLTRSAAVTGSAALRFASR